ncbi:MAG: glycoside hydrolase family 5 protein [Oscillospiraceae bacterium]|nr:glycoside hydrolase family 5 protein [Oscillospiraceae bacterium]
MKKFLSVFLAAFILVLSLAGCAKEPVLHEHNNPEVEGTEYKTQAELIEAMGMGWNLGNTLDAPDGETSWGQPVTTKDMMLKLKELGFNSVRIPVSWGKHVSSAPEYIIDDKWMARVREVVDYALEADLIVIINSHHDNDIYEPRKNNGDEAVQYLSAIWAQIAQEFKDYDQRLIFEAMNEPRLVGTKYEWWLDMNAKDCQYAAEIVNTCNQAFVDVVRAASGKNTDRYLLSSVYCGAPDSAMIDEYILPADTAENKIMLAVHAYTPYDLAMGDDMSINSFGTNEKNSINWFIDRLYNKFVKNGVHVVIDEMGIINKNNPLARYEWAKYYVSKAKENGMACMVWDNGNDATGHESYALFDRRNLKIFDSCEPVYKGFMDGINGTDSMGG